MTKAQTLAEEAKSRQGGSGRFGSSQICTEPHMTRRLLRLKPASEYISLSTWTLRRMIQQGELPAVITCEGAPWLVDVKDLDFWIEQKKTRLE